MKHYLILLAALLAVVCLCGCETTEAKTQPNIEATDIASEIVPNDYLEDQTVDQIMTTLCGEYKTATTTGSDGYIYVTFVGRAKEGFSVGKGSEVKLRFQCILFDDGTYSSKLKEATYGLEATDEEEAYKLYNLMCMEISGESPAVTDERDDTPAIENPSRTDDPVNIDDEVNYGELVGICDEEDNYYSVEELDEIGGNIYLYPDETCSLYIITDTSKYEMSGVYDVSEYYAQGIGYIASLSGTVKYADGTSSSISGNYNVSADKWGGISLDFDDWNCALFFE